MQSLRKFAITFVLLLGVTTAAGQQADCPALVEQAIAATAEACANMARNEACYGNVDVSATLREGVAAEFTQVGDLAPLADISSLTLAALDVDAGTWGVALMSVQANLPDTLPGQNVIFVLFGDVEISAAETETAEGEAPPPPMQAFYIRSGLGDAPCAEAPNSGLLIQTPQGAGQIDLTINDVQITLGSTAYIQAEAEGNMVFNIIEGLGRVQVGEAAREVPAGARVLVPLDEELRAAGEPSEPEPYELADVEALPLTLLPDEISAAMPITADALAAFGERISLTPGTWRITVSSIEGCGLDSTTVNAILSSMPTTEFDIEGGTMESFFQRAVAAAGGGATVTTGDMTFVITSSAANVYTVEFEAGGAVVRSELTVVSPTRIEFVQNAADSAAGCTLTSTGSYDYVGG
ncbi:MAG: hypothetical protein HXY40_00300 [Chloroflexi bacterium]|nr:hypothetical protein [Chloroflexota bacterium]